MTLLRVEGLAKRYGAAHGTALVLVTHSDAAAARGDGIGGA